MVRSIILRVIFAKLYNLLIGLPEVGEGVEASTVTNLHTNAHHFPVIETLLRWYYHDITQGLRIPAAVFIILPIRCKLLVLGREDTFSHNFFICIKLL